MGRLGLHWVEWCYNTLVNLVEDLVQTGVSGRLSADDIVVVALPRWISRGKQEEQDGQREEDELQGSVDAQK